MNAPLVSVIMAVYNCSEFLRASLDSILNQTLKDLEVILVDDGSDNDVQDILRCYYDPRLKIVRLARNIGLTKCLNIAIDQATGTIFARHDGDDIAFPDRLNRELALMTNRVGLVSCWAEAIDENGNVVPDAWLADVCQTGDEVERLLPEKNCVLSPGAMFTRQAFERIGYFDPTVRCAQDYNYWLRLNREFAIDIVPEILVQKRSHPNSIWAIKHDVDWITVAKSRAATNPVIFLRDA